MPDHDASYGERTSAANPYGPVRTPADPRGGFAHNPEFSMVRTMDNGAVIHPDGSADQAVIG